MVNNIVQKLHECSQNGLEHIIQIESTMYDTGIISSSEVNGMVLIQLEAAILHMASVPGLVKGMVYWFPVLLPDRQVVLR